ncbi:MAG: DUF2182 domain-containing protein [Myxococcota bacterium]
MDDRVPAPGPGSLPRRDRNTILIGLAGVTALAWIYLVVSAANMQGMGDPAAAEGVASAGSMMRVHPWSALDFALMFAMWAVMMVGMMVPTAAPMALIYAAVARKAASQGTPLASTAVFVSGYVVAWTAFSVAATAVQWGLDSAALLSPRMVTTSPILGALLLMASGLYQLTPIKNACLEHCRAPARFIASHWHPGASGAFRVGLEHGFYCLGCCWLLMGLLFLGGVMNLLWIAGITGFVLLEKVAPRGLLGGRFAGVSMIAVGGFLALRWAVA